MKIKKLIKFLCCPYCHQDKLILKSRKIICPSCQINFNLIKNIPVLLKVTKLNSQEKSQQSLFHQHYLASSSKNYQLENWRLSMLKRVFKINFKNKLKTYLDIGCGDTGYTVIEAAKRYHCLAFGVDISLPAIIKAEKIAKKQGLEEKTAFLVASAENLPFKTDFFDYISALSVLEHIEDDKKVIRQIHAILKRKKYLYLCLPNTYRKIWPFFWPIYYYFDQKIGHKRHYSKESLIEKFEKNHLFKIKKIFYNGHLLKLWQLLLEKIHLIDEETWWRWEAKDINQNPWALQLNAILQKF